MHAIITQLDNRVRNINNDVIKLDLLISHTLDVPPDEERIARADGKKDARRDGTREKKGEEAGPPLRRTHPTLVGTPPAERSTGLLSAAGTTTVVAHGSRRARAEAEARGTSVGRQGGRDVARAPQICGSGDSQRARDNGNAGDGKGRVIVKLN